MGRSGLLILGLVLNVAHCLDILGQVEAPAVEITRNVTAVLGEDVHLGCRYLGEGEIQSAKWTRQINSHQKSKALAGFSGGRPFGRGHFSAPDSPTNLTVKVAVSSVDVEGEYVCEFESEEEGYFTGRAFVAVVARPDVQLRVTSETANGTHYQSVRCSATGGRPAPRISWSVGGLAPSGFPFAVAAGDPARRADGTFGCTSVLRFPTHLQDEEAVTCLVEHPALANPQLATARVETYVRPNVSVEAELVRRGGSDFWVVSCISSGGRPDADVSLAPSTGEALQRDDGGGADGDVRRSSVSLPAAAYQGRTVACVFDHPKFPRAEARAVALPSFHLSGARLLVQGPRIHGEGFQGLENLELREGRGQTVGLEVIGNVPRYNVTCKKDDGPLPEGVELVGRNLTVREPAARSHAGLYECVLSYGHLEAALRINVTVRPRATLPVPPAVRVDLRAEGGRAVIECSAADAVPAANVSWLLPEGVSGVSWSNSSSRNGSHSVRGVVLLPACVPRELAAVCVINHPALEEPENRSVTLPLCARVNVTVNASTEWRAGQQFTRADCWASSVAPAPSIAWHVGGSGGVAGDQYEAEARADGSVAARGSVRFLSSAHAGRSLTCTVDHPSLGASESRTIRVPAHYVPLLNVSLARPRGSALWLAVCACSGEGAGANLAWVLPANAEGPTPLRSEVEGRTPKARLTYRFPPALHEGQDLTCEYRLDRGGDVAARRSVHVPRYYISSVRVVNHTTPLQSRYGGDAVVHRLALRENRHDQEIVLRVEGNVPSYDLSCERSDGSFGRMKGPALVFRSERDAGRYTCRASFYHHAAAVQIQVEVTGQDELLWMLALTCASSALAVLVLLAIALWICRLRNGRTQHKKRESLSALTSLMQEHGSPEVRKPQALETDSAENAQLCGYSIVIDVKSTV